jgi:hypothetical protein
MLRRTMQTTGWGAAGVVLLSALVAVGCGGSGSVTGPELPGEEIYLQGGSAMLRVDRTLDFGTGGAFEMETELTLTTDQIFITDPNQRSRVFGYTEAEAEAILIGTGTGGSHTETAWIPVEYQVEGVFHPAPRCEWELKIIETLFLSKVTSIHSTLFGTISVDGLGADRLTDFDVEFDQQTRDYAVIGAQGNMFSIFDIVLPEGTGCRF